MQIKDQLHTVFEFLETPKRIVSLVPSQTELLVDLGLTIQLVGITKFCIHPKALRNEVKVVGGTKTIHLDRIKALKPDIIICNKEENTKEIVEACSEIAPVWLSDIYTVDDSLDMISLLGELFNKEEKAFQIIEKIKNEYYSFYEFMKGKQVKKVAYLIWENPFMAAGQQTFINDLLRINKFENVLKDPASRYPEISINALKEVDLVLLSSEPFPFKEKHVQELEEATQKEVQLVDGEYFSWYGSRLQYAFTYFRFLH
ncbi:MAG: iron complex transport system substrate-binding protein [Patiriisocius sp.]|jgi:ABC-type Fe3+-hydroxamate transport system substrate-binding protein